MSHRPNRREFLKGAAGAAALFGSAPIVISAPKTKPNAKPKIRPTTATTFHGLNVAIIGVDGRGRSNFDAVVELGANIVAVCDVDASRVARAGFEFHADAYIDFREMLTKQSNIDAVVISTPDHMHAEAALMAIRQGHHVYCEKPLTHNIREARLLLEAARKYKVATQMGNQGHASEGSRVQVECIQAGVIGAVKEVHICTDRPIWPQGMNRPTTHEVIPETLAWNIWLGPAEYRPYNSAYQPFKWRGWWDFGTGALGDMACHLMDAPYWALDLKDPISVEAQSNGGTSEAAPNWSIITYEFPARGSRPALKAVWYDGGKLPPKELTGDHPLPDKNNYIIYVGTSGTLVAALNSAPTLVGDKDKKFQPPPKSIPRSKGHHEEFLMAAMGGPPAGSNFEYSVPLTEMVLLGNLAIRTGKKVLWDSAKMTADSPEANRYVTREYRDGWEV